MLEAGGKDVSEHGERDTGTADGNASSGPTAGKGKEVDVKGGLG